MYDFTSHLADALNLGRVQGVQLGLVLHALGQDATGALQQLLDFGLGRLGQHVQLAEDFTMDPPDAGAQLDQRVTHVDQLVQPWTKQLTGLRL